jgi:hypothetical protein
MLTIPETKTFIDPQGFEVMVCQDIDTQEFGSYYKLPSGSLVRVENIPMMQSPFRAQDMLDEYATDRGWKVKK